MKNQKQSFFHRLDKSVVWTIVGVLFLFSTSIVVTLIAPQYVDPSWTEPSSIYQVQMHDVADPNLYVNAAAKRTETLQFVHHLKEDYTLLAFVESASTRIIAPPHLEKYVTRVGAPATKLTSKLLLLRKPAPSTSPDGFLASVVVEQLQKKLQEKWVKANPGWQEKRLAKPYYEIYELYSPGGTEAFSLAETDGVFEHWIDKNFQIIDEAPQQRYHLDEGVLYVKNPQEYRVSPHQIGSIEGWKFDPKGKKIENVEELTSPQFGFMSREQLIDLGEHIFAIEGCWYCHTDQCRTLVQDTVLNGTPTFPAPPSSANEYIYNRITFPGTRRIGPDISRAGVKRPSREWHKAHFWAPREASPGTIMPAYRHFFDKDPQITSKSPFGVPNYRFEAVYQYLMTKGTRITPPTQAWWKGEDPIQTLLIIDGVKTTGKWSNVP